jgi:hypothetical protein
LKENYIVVTADQDVTITKIPTGGSQASIWSYKDNASFPRLLSRDVKLHDITYKLYYLVLREGVGQSPCNVDEVFTTYKGEYLTSSVVEGVTTQTTTKFEEWKYEIKNINLVGVIRGWKEIFPQFKTGNNILKSDGTISHTDFGAGVMFIPSGLGYYAAGKGVIPGYVPLIFSFKLYEIQRLDHEYNIETNASTPDGVLSFQEDIDGDGYMWTKGELPTGAINPDDTDGDGIPDFLDLDDDGDGYGTRSEIMRPNVTVNGVSTANGFYPYNGAAIDDPLTPNIDERQGIPAYIKASKTLDYTTSGRTRVYLDKDYPVK